MSSQGQHQIRLAEKISKLLFRRMNGKMTPAQSLELDNWLNQQDAFTREYLEEISEWPSIEGDLLLFARFDVKSAFIDVQTRIADSD